MKNILRFTAAFTVIALTLPGLRATESAAPSATPASAAPAANEPILTISLPANLKAEDVTAAVAKAFTSRKWVEVNTTGNTVTASLNQGGVSIKATANTSATEVKLFAEFTSTGKADTAKAKKATHRWFKYIEDSTKENLGLTPPKTEKAKQDKKPE